MGFAENLDAYLLDFGIDATLNLVAIRGIFDDAYADPLGFSGSTPALLVKSSEASGAAQGMAVVVNTVNYIVASIKPDGAGMTQLLLSEV